MTKKIDYKELIARINARRAVLERASKNLKKKFVGLDRIIDSVIDNINVWYIMPELVTRPTIINLWGMTGVGKTDLIRSLVKELKFGDRFLEVQLTNKGNLYYSTVQAYLSNSAIEYDEPGIMLLDEIQRFRTVDQNNQEIHDCKFQDIWTLLSDGCFSSDSNSKQNLLEMLFGDSYYKQTDMEDEDEVEEDDDKEVLKRRKEKRKKRKYHRTYYSAISLKKQLKLTESVEEIMRWTEEKKFTLVWDALKGDEVYEGDSYSKLLIFISGNLDEAYDMADQTGNADHDADVFHDFSSRINIVDIKNALSGRFKPEQISRLGNIHIIYPSLSKKSYQSIIRRKVNEVIRNVKNKHGVKIKVDKSVRECIYRNGVFPAQGVRPVFSSVSSLLGASVPTFIMIAIENKKKEFSILYRKDNLIAQIGGKSYKYKIECSIDKIKEENNEDELTLTSVHEAGHAVAYASLFGISPTQIVSSMSSSDTGGFIGLHKITHSQKDTYNKIIVMMAGKVAEEMIFGENYATSGASGDIATASRLASSYFRDWGMGDVNAKITNQHLEHAVPANYDMSGTNEAIEQLITKCKFEAREIVNSNVDFLIKCVEILVDKGEIKPDSFKTLARKYGLDIRVIAPKESVLSRYRNKFEKFKQKDSTNQKAKKSLTSGYNREKISIAASKKK